MSMLHDNLCGEYLCFGLFQHAFRLYNTCGHGTNFGSRLKVDRRAHLATFQFILISDDKFFTLYLDYY